jgi:hypothetical protein
LQATTAAEQVPTAWVGTWRLNVARSTYSPGPPPYRRASHVIEPWNDGLKITSEMVYPRGGITHVEWIGKLDGREYEVQGPDELITYAYRAVGDGSYDITVRIGGRIAAISHVSVSSDQRSMITRTKGRDAAGREVETVTVYEKD